MQTLEGMQAERRLREQIGRHSRRIQELASNPLYDPDAVKREKAKLRVEFMEELARDFTRSVGRLKALKTAAQRALSRRRVEDKLAEKPTDTLAARQLKATKRLEREMVMARTREELALLAAIEPARLVSTYHEALELAREAPGSVEWTARVEAIEETAPKLLERAILSADGADRSAARRALAYIDSAKKDALKSLRPESARQLEAVQNANSRHSAKSKRRTNSPGARPRRSIVRPRTCPCNRSKNPRATPATPAKGATMRDVEERMLLRKIQRLEKRITRLEAKRLGTARRGRGK